MPKPSVLLNNPAQEMIVGRREVQNSGQMAYMNKSMAPTTDAKNYETEGHDSSPKARFANQLFKTSLNNPSNIPILQNSLIIRSFQPSVTKISQP